MMFLAESGSRSKLVDLDVPLWAWIVLSVCILSMLAIDLFRHDDDHEPNQKDALKESLVWVGCGRAFGVFIWLVFGTAAFGEYISGYLIEKSLSVDNVFVWALIFTTMAVPLRYQHRVLFWGIFGALTLRAIFITVGSALVSAFWWVLVLFGAFLIFTGVKIIRHRDDEGEDAVKESKLLERFFPVTDAYDGHKFFTRIDGKRFATPLLSALVVIELSDVLFAVDSVPAILAVSNEVFLIFASNAFAILGLRAMYFLLADAKERFHYLSHALGFILVFVGLKMTVSHWFHLNTYLSLGIIVAILVAAIVFSIKKNQSADA